MEVFLYLECLARSICVCWVICKWQWLFLGYLQEKTPEGRIVPVGMGPGLLIYTRWLILSVGSSCHFLYRQYYLICWWSFSYRHVYRQNYAVVSPESFLSKLQSWLCYSKLLSIEKVEYKDLNCGSKLPVACISGSTVLYTETEEHLSKALKGGVMELFFAIFFF